MNIQSATILTSYKGTKYKEVQLIKRSKGKVGKVGKVGEVR